MNAHDPSYNLRESDPARFEFIDGDMLSPRLMPEASSDWRDLCDDNAPPMSAEQERAFWLLLGCTLAAKRERAVGG